MARSSRLSCLKIHCENLLKNQGFEANLALLSEYDQALRWA